MFGKYDWFHFVGAVPFPKTSEGVWYWAGWVSAILLPAFTLNLFGLGIEMTIWLVISALALIADVKSIKSVKRRRDELDSLYQISDDDPDQGCTAETEKYTLSSR
jgi:hypothetical protein